MANLADSVVEVVARESPATVPVFDCSLGSCQDVPMVGWPEVSRVGADGRNRHYHYGCAP